MNEKTGIVAGVDVGTECVKVLVLDASEAIVGRAVVPTRGRFEDCIEEAFSAALDEAQVSRDELSHICATGFGARCVSDATLSLSETVCHTKGATRHFSAPMTVVDIGGRDPKAIYVDADGRPQESRSVRRCAVGIGTFLMFAARHLEVYPTRLEELAAAAEGPAEIGSYCSVFAGSEILERLLEGKSPEQVALGCIHSVAERVFEIGAIKPPVVISGGVAEYFPGVLKALGQKLGTTPEVMPEPIMTASLGAALHAARELQIRSAAHAD